MVKKFIVGHVSLFELEPETIDTYIFEKVKRTIRLETLL